MDEEIFEDLDFICDGARELAKRYRSMSEETIKLQSLVSAMETDHKKAMRLFAEHERMQKDRERLRSKISGLVDKLDQLRIS